MAALTPAALDEASRRILSRLEAWTLWQEAPSVALFASLPGEVPTDPLLQAQWSRGHAVWLPWTAADGSMEMAPVRGPEELVCGRYGIREPRLELRGGVMPRRIPVFTPGTVFDLSGGRLGRGRGFYDRWFACHDAVAIGLCLEVQVTSEMLPRAPHDWPMSHLFTEARQENFG